MEKLNDGFDEPHDITPAQQAFPANVVGTLMPFYKDVPDEFKVRGSARGPWNQFVSTWFFTGWPTDQGIIPREGIDPEKAITHISTLMGSYEPKHEHKEAACAWLLSRWFSEVITLDEENEDA